MAPIQILAAFDALDAVYGAAGLVVGGVGVFLLVSLLSSASLKNAKRDATALVDSAKADAESMASEQRAALEKELTEARSELKTQQDRVDKREESLDRKFDQISTREIKLDDKETRLEAMETEAKSIAGLLEMQRKRAAIQAHIADLRQKNVTMVSPEKLSTLEMTFDGELRPRRRPGTLSERAARRKK